MNALRRWRLQQWWSLFIAASLSLHGAWSWSFTTPFPGTKRVVDPRRSTSYDERPRRKGKTSRFVTTTLLAASSSSSSSSSSSDIQSDCDQWRNGDQEDEEPTYFSPNVPLDELPFQTRSQQQTKDDNSAAETTTTNTNSNNDYSFFDEAVVFVRAGSGGRGATTHKPVGLRGRQNGPPDGGCGGRGGHVIVRVDPSLNTLAGLSHAWRPNAFGGSGATARSHGRNSHRPQRPKSFRAEHGADGDRQFRNGRSGKDVEIRVPPGTVVQQQIVDDETGEVVESIELGTLTAAATRTTGEEDRDAISSSPSSTLSSLIVARGGEGGEGTAVHGSNRRIRRPRVPPTGGERKRLLLTLQLVADVALVGVPNAGKSTFLAAVTRAKPKIANYPFTTIVPNLGVWIPGSSSNKSDHQQNNNNNNNADHSMRGAGSDGLVLCDVPGLIAGAADGAGLGHQFLRHVERCHVILHLIDATSNDPVADYEMLNREIVKYGGADGGGSPLATLPQVVVVNKVDAFDDYYAINHHDSSDANGAAGNDWERGLRVRTPRHELEAKLRGAMPHTRLLWMSARERDGVDELMTRLAAFVKKVKAEAKATTTTSKQSRV